MPSLVILCFCHVLLMSIPTQAACMDNEVVGVDKFYNTNAAHFHGMQIGSALVA